MPSKKLLWLLPLALLSACGSAEYKEYKNATSAITDSTAVQVDSDDVKETIAGLPINSPARKVIHTAHFRCRVQNVFNATTRLEQMVKATGGVVQESRIDNNNAQTKTSYYTGDSLRQTTTYTTTATLVLRVPSMYIDSIINEVPGLCSFIDERSIAQSDVTNRYLANELKNQTDNSAAGKAIRRAKNSTEALQVQQYQDQKQEQRIDRKIENLGLMDDVNYATVTVALSQPQQVMVQTIANPDYLGRTPFWLECKAALVNGWNIIKTVLLIIIDIWPFLLLAIAGWYMYTRLLRRRIVAPHK